MIRVTLPTHLRELSGAPREIQVHLDGPATIPAVLDVLEARYPMLRGTIRDHATLRRRPFIRFFACGQDFSNEPPEFLLPASVAAGDDLLRIVGAMAGG